MDPIGVGAAIDAIGVHGGGPASSPHRSLSQLTNAPRECGLRINYALCCID